MTLLYPVYSELLNFNFFWVPSFWHSLFHWQWSQSSILAFTFLWVSLLFFFFLILRHSGYFLCCLLCSYFIYLIKMSQYLRGISTVTVTMDCLLFITRRCLQILCWFLNINSYLLVLGFGCGLLGISYYSLKSVPSLENTV